MLFLSAIAAASNQVAEPVCAIAVFQTQYIITVDMSDAHQLCQCLESVVILWDRQDANFSSRWQMFDSHHFCDTHHHAL